MIDMSERYLREKLQKEKLELLYQNTILTPFEQFRNFPVFTPRFNLARFITHYELFKKVYELPGIIIDLGVFRGASLFTWAKLCEIFCPTDVRKTVYGFDTFEGFPTIMEEDGTEEVDYDKHPGGYYAGSTVEKDLQIAIEAMDIDRHIAEVPRIKLIKGDACVTIPDFVKSFGNGLRICLLNLDLDLYEPTKVALDCFMPFMVKGGIIIADEYAVKTFGGESKALDDWFQENRGERPQLQKFNWHSNPSAYLTVNW